MKQIDKKINYERLLMNMANMMNDFLFEKIFFSSPCCLLYSTLIIKGAGFNLFTSKSSLLCNVNITLALGSFFIQPDRG